MWIRACAAIFLLVLAKLSLAQDLAVSDKVLPERPRTSIANVPNVEKAPKIHWAWMTSLVVLDAVQVGDVLSSRGGIDRNSLVGNSNGTFNTERAVVLKTAVYGSVNAAQLILHRYNHHHSDAIMTAANSVVSGFYGWVIVHNTTIQNQAVQNQAVQSQTLQNQIIH